MPVKAVKTQKAVKPRKKFKEQDLSVFINLLTDFGFKRVFGIKKVMLSFLNTVLDISGGIVDLTYGNVEILGLTKEDRKAIFDLICITGNGERVIVEIQNIEQEHYKDRMLFYLSLLIQEQNVQGKVGDKNWNYKLDPVFSINILNFHLGKKKRPNRYLTHWLIKERDTNEAFYDTDRFTLVCVELPLFDKTLQGVKTALEQWIFLIKNLHELNSIPEKYKTEVFENIFEMAKIAKMDKKEVSLYLKSLNEMNMVQYEINRRDRAIEVRDNTIMQQGNTIMQQGNTIAIVTSERDNAWNIIAQKDKEIEELKRRFGLN